MSSQYQIQERHPVAMRPLLAHLKISQEKDSAKAFGKGGCIHYMFLLHPFPSPPSHDLVSASAVLTGAYKHTEYLKCF